MKSTGKPKYVGAWKQWLPAVCIMYKEVYGNSGIKGGERDVLAVIEKYSKVLKLKRN